MKIVKILLIVFLAGLLSTIIFFYAAFRETTWGGWKPPSTDLILTKKEKEWKKEVESNYNCAISFIGLDNNFEEDSIIYISIDYNDNSILFRRLNEQIDLITKNISSSFVSSAENKRPQSHIWINFNNRHNFKLDTVLNNVPKERYCLYDIKSKATLPTVDNLIISKFPYFDFGRREIDLFYYKIGGNIKRYLHCSSQEDTILTYYFVQSGAKFKNLEGCEVFTSKIPFKIDLADGYIESKHQFTSFYNECISVKINYKCYPKNKKIQPKDFVKKVTEISPERLKNSKKDKLDLIGIMKKNNFNFRKNLFGVTINFKVDTLKQPWSIEYETSLNEFQYYKD